MKMPSHYDEITLPSGIERKVRKAALRVMVTARLKTLRLVVALGALMTALFCVPRTNADVVPFTEVYGTASDGTPLHWVVYTPAGVGPWPAMLVLHTGFFNEGTPTWTPAMNSCAQDLAEAGYIVFSIEYRLAPCLPDSGPTCGPLPGQVSDGRFPDQIDDVRLAVKTARVDSRCNGKVGAIGGSAGASHVAYVAGTGTAGDDRIDVGIALSGAYDLSDLNLAENIDTFIASVCNYAGVTSDDTAGLRTASPAWAMDNKTVPLLLANSMHDTMPYAQISDLIQHLDALGVTNYQAISLTGSGHAFDDWAPLKNEALAFLADGFAGTPFPTPTPPPNPTSKKLLNVSTRSNVGTGDTVMIGGFVVSGDTDKRVILRGIGPSLSGAGITGALSDPVLELFDSTGTLIEANDNRVQIPGIPNPLLPPNASESLLMGILPPGSYTAVLSGTNLGTGIGLIEAYDVDAANSRLGNISTRAVAATGNGEMIGGFIIGEGDPTSVLVRALGPSLVTSGIANFLPDPVIEVHDSNGALIAVNDNWKTDQEQQIIATGDAPADDREAAIIRTFAPGSYTAVIHDAKFSSGIALFDSYDLESQ